MSLYQLQRSALERLFTRHKCNYRHLIVDDTTYPLIQQLFKDDILNYVYTFYKIDDKKRSTNKDKAIYLLDPISQYSMDCLCADFSRGMRYSDAVLCVLPGIDTDTLNRLFRDNRYIHEATRGGYETVEVLALQPIENRVYVTGCNYSIPAYYNLCEANSGLPLYQIERATDAMVGMCLLTKDYPIVRYFNSQLSKALAKRFQAKLDEYYRSHPELAPVGSKTVFLVTDRTMDMFGPFCHYKYYRAQLFDLMDTHIKKKRGQYTFAYEYKIQTGQGMETKYLVFDDDDPVYSQLKDMSMEDYTQKIVEMFNNLKEEDSRYNNLKYTSDLTHAALNQSDHMFNKQLITGHFELISRINDEFQKEGILDLVVFENESASNMGINKKLYEPVTDELIQLLSNEAIFMGNKIRLLIVYATYRGGLIKSDYEKLLHFCMPDKAESVLTLLENLKKLHLNLFKESLHRSPAKYPTYFDVRDTQELTERMIPTYTNLVLRLAENRLPELYTTKTADTYYGVDAQDQVEEDDKTFPYTRGAPVSADAEMASAMQGMQLGSGGIGGRGGSRNGSTDQVRAQPKWKSTKAGTSGYADLSRQKLMIFCAGGLTESELSTILSQEDRVNKNIFVGADEIYSTWDLIGDIRLINDQRANFNFPMDQKKKQRQVPDYLYENSGPASAAGSALPGGQQKPEEASHRHGKGLHLGGGHLGHLGGSHSRVRLDQSGQLQKPVYRETPGSSGSRTTSSSTATGTSSIAGSEGKKKHGFMKHFKKK